MAQAPTRARPIDYNTPMSQTEQATESKRETKSAAKQVELPADLPQRLEAALLTTDRAMSAAKLAGLFEGATVKVVTDAIDELNKTYNASKRSFRIEEVAGGYQMLTLPEYSGVLDALPVSYTHLTLPTN